MCEYCQEDIVGIAACLTDMVGLHIVVQCNSGVRRVTDIPDNNTSHITEECHNASLGARQQPDGE